MATTFQQTVYKMINEREEVREKMKKLPESTNDDLAFFQNSDGSIACRVTYKGYNIAFRLTEKEVYNRVVKTNKNAGDAINEIIEEKMTGELLKDE